MPKAQPNLEDMTIDELDEYSADLKGQIEKAIEGLRDKRREAKAVRDAKVQEENIKRSLNLGSDANVVVTPGTIIIKTGGDSDN